MQFGVPAEKQKWYFKGRLLEDNDTLWKAGVHSLPEELEIEVVAA